MSETNHTPTPWYAQFNGNYWDITTEPEQYSPFLASVFSPENVRDGQANAEHIVKCVNAHDALVAALRAIAALSNAPTRHVDDYGDIARSALRDAGIEVIP